MIRTVYDLCQTLKSSPVKIELDSALYDWLLNSNWDCLLSDKLKNYINNGGKVKRI